MAKWKKIVELLKLSVSDEEQKVTSGSIDRAIFLLAVPMMLEMIMESLFAVVDVFFVSKLGVNATATVGLTESMMTIVYSIGIGLSAAATAVVARRIGEWNAKDASIAAAQSLYIGLFFSLILSVIGAVFAEDLLRAMGASEELISEGIGYTRLVLAANFGAMFLFLINGIFRGAGNAGIAMRTLWLSNGLNIILCPIFIFGWGPIPAFGVMGAAIATTIGRSVGVCYQLYHLFKGKGIIKVTKEALLVRWAIVKNILSIASGGTGQYLIASASWIFLVRIVSDFGPEALAGYTIAFRTIVFCILPAWGIANAAATLVGQNLGAEQPDRAEKSVWRTGQVCAAFLGLVMIFFLFTAEQLIGFFTIQDQVIIYGVQCLQLVSLGNIAYAYEMVIGMAFNGAGDTRTPTILNFFGFWLFQIPLAYVMATVLGMGPKGVFSAVGISEAAIAVAAIILFKRGKWKLVKV